MLIIVPSGFVDMCALVLALCTLISIGHFSNTSVTKQPIMAGPQGAGWMGVRIEPGGHSGDRTRRDFSGRPEPISRCRAGGRWGIQSRSLKVLSFVSSS